MDPTIKADPLFRFLSQIGITSLFVFAGLEVNIKELNEDKGYLTRYLAKSTLLLGVIAYAFSQFFSVPFQESFILSLGIFTPSAGFILNSLHSFKMTEDHEYWIKSKAISKEVIAIVLLFLALQGNNAQSLIISLAFYIGLIFFLPKIFRLFFKFVSPYAPNSEVPFLIALALISGVISKELGAYYLVGAFLVGIVSSRFKDEIFREDEEIIFKSLSSFFTVFLPFYFFYAGLKISLKEFQIEALYIGIAALIIFVPLRVILISTSIKMFLKDVKEKAYGISASLMPTLIFGLVIATILKERGIIDIKYVYALIIYTILTSLLPTVLFSFKKAKS